MIGPSSGPSKMPAREVVENPVGVKRKVFDDLDIESLCEEVCQNGKKRFLTELRGPMETQVNLQDLVESAEFTTDDEQVSNSVNSVARLEVLVVDGNWDPSSLEGHPEFTDISNSAIQTLNDVQSDENGYETILEYWEPTNTDAPQHNVNGNIENITVNTQNATLPVTYPVEDQENGNLSWLLDFKLDSFIEAPEERNTFTNNRDNHSVHRNRYNSSSSRVNGSNDLRKSYSHTENISNQSSSSHQNEARQPIVPNGSYALTDSRSFAISRYGGPKKPPFTYTELIEHALQERGELTVSAIYQWISEHFPYYKSNDDRWKNSVRHNLSINPHFRKGSKAPHGAGHLWAIANRGDTRPRQLTTNGAIPPAPRQLGKNAADTSSGTRRPSNINNQTVTVDEVAAATASISPPEEPAAAITNSVTLEHCAEQILSGIKREVEVQYLVPMVLPNNETQQQDTSQHVAQQTEHNEQASKDTDFLNPVSKEEVAEECGLLGESYLVTDLNPTALGLNMVEPEIITPENLFGEELSFQFYELTSPSQLQSA